MWAEPTCPTGKHVYLTWTHAESDAKQLRRKGSKRVLPFRCPRCRGIHTGSSTVKRQKRNPRKDYR